MPTTPTHQARPGPPHRRRWWWILAAGLAAAIWAATTGPATADPAPVPPPPPVATTPAAPAPVPTPPPTQTPPTGPSQGPPTAPHATPTTPAVPTTPGAPAPGTGSGPGEVADPDCGINHISGCVIKAMDGFFSNLVSVALNPLLELLSSTLLTTPDPASLPRVGQLWSSSWEITVTVYGLLVMAAGVLLMSYQTLQSRWSVGDIAPRLVIGMVAAALSFPLATEAVRVANAVSEAVAGDDIDQDSASQALRQLLTAHNGAGIFGLLLSTVLVVLVTALLVGYVIRVVVTIVLIVAAPLALMCHGFPPAEPIARWWWRAMSACLAIQVVQSLVLIAIARVFLTPDGSSFFASVSTGPVNLIVSIALLGILAKVPFWMLSAMRIGHGRSMTGQLVRGFIAYKTFGLLRKGGSALAGSLRPSKPAVPQPPPRKPSRAERDALRDAADPYWREKTTTDGQMLLPLKGLQRVKRNPTPPAPATKPVRRVPGAPPSPHAGKQLALDLFKPGPQLPPEAARPDGQRALFYASPARKRPRPAEPARAARPRTASAAAGGSPAAGDATPPVRPVKRAPKGRQLALRFPPPQPAASASPPPAPGPRSRPRDPYARPQVTAEGQYVLPLGVTRVPRPAPAPAPAWVAPPAPRPQGRQLHLPLPDLPVRRRRRPTTPGGAS